MEHFSAIKCCDTLQQLSSATCLARQIYTHTAVEDSPLLNISLRTGNEFSLFFFSLNRLLVCEPFFLTLIFFSSTFSNNITETYLLYVEIEKLPHLDMVLRDGKHVPSAFKNLHNIA